MPLWFLYVFAGVALAAIVVRYAVPGDVRPARTSSWTDIVLVVLGGLGLAYHCGAMFYPSTFDGALGLGGYATTIKALGAGSVVAFAVPSVLLLAGVRRMPVWYVALVAVVLAAVGVTMYDGGPLDAHLTAIMVAAVVIITGVVLLTPDPPRRRAGPTGPHGHPAIWM